jgi:hypothetical protein
MNKKYLNKILILTIILSIGMINFASATVVGSVENGGGAGITGGILGKLETWGITGIVTTIATINFALGYLGGVLVFLGGNLANWALSLNADIINSPSVQTGWVISRDLANLGFVLAIILIAFITILRIESYQTKQMLTRLITAALLVNFSLVIAGVFIDFSGVMTDFFINKATNNSPSKMADGFAQGLQVQKMLKVTADQEKIQKTIEGVTGISLIPFAMSIFFVALFTGIAAISLFGLAAMLFIRYIALTILLILMPLAWLLWIWPDFEGQWRKWWSEFFRWVWFAPAVSFFIYLALKLSEPGNEGIYSLSGTEGLGLTLADAGQIIGNMIAVLGILIGGLITANSMGIAGAGITMDAANKFKGFVTGAVPGAAGRGVGSGFNTFLSKGIPTFTGGKTGTELLRAVTARASRIPLVGAAAQEWNRQLAVRDQERLENIQKDAEQMDPEARRNAFKSSFDPIRQSALLAAMANKGDLDKAKAAYGYNSKTKQWDKPENQARFESIASRAIQRGGKVAKTLSAKDPHLAALDPKIEGGGRVKYDIQGKPLYTNQQKEAVQKAIKGMDQEAISNMNIDLLENPEFLSQIKPGNLLKFAERGYEDQAKVVKIINEQLSKGVETIGMDLHNKFSAMAKTITDSPAWAHKPVVSEKKGPEEQKGPRSSTEPVSGINLKPPPQS